MRTEISAPQDKARKATADRPHSLADYCCLRVRDFTT
jgi:hypothetical protein